MICCIEGCKNYTQHAGMCNLHYRRARRAVPLAKRKRPWSESERAIVRANRGLGPSKMMGLLPGRSYKAIQAMVYELTHDPLEGVMVGAALVMWKGPADRSRALVPALGLAA